MECGEDAPAVVVVALARRPSSEPEVRSSFPDMYWSPYRGRKWDSGAVDLHTAVSTTLENSRKYTEMRISYNTSNKTTLWYAIKFWK